MKTGDIVLFGGRPAIVCAAYEGPEETRQEAQRNNRPQRMGEFLDLRIFGGRDEFKRGVRVDTVTPHAEATAAPSSPAPKAKRKAK